MNYITVHTTDVVMMILEFSLYLSSVNVGVMISNEQGCREELRKYA